jgi:hypothetical protein
VISKETVENLIDDSANEWNFYRDSGYYNQWESEDGEWLFKVSYTYNRMGFTHLMDDYAYTYPLSYPHSDDEYALKYIEYYLLSPLELYDVIIDLFGEQEIQRYDADKFTKDFFEKVTIPTRQ